MKEAWEIGGENLLSAQYLLDKRQVYIFGEIRTEMAARVIPQMHYVEKRILEEGSADTGRVMTVLINSPGGSVTDGLAIYDTINALRCDVQTICVGQAASMAALLLSSGTYGMRLALPNSEILIHQPLGGTQGQAADIILAAEHIARTRGVLGEILAKNTGKELAQILRDTDRDNVMTAQQALEYGLIDRVLMPERVKAEKGA